MEQKKRFLQQHGHKAQQGLQKSAEIIGKPMVGRVSTRHRKLRCCVIAWVSAREGTFNNRGNCNSRDVCTSSDAHKSWDTYNISDACNNIDINMSRYISNIRDQLAIIC